ncbi:radical SAM protein [PVC group bacterium]|nr:radical SAM protein [PVC group bacterium]
MSSLFETVIPRLRAYSHVASSRLRIADFNAPLPSITHLLITWRCNLKCTGCDAWKRKQETELSADDWRKVFRSLHFLDVVKMIGGEPFIRDDLEEIILALKEEINPFVLQLVTNGTMTDRIVDFMERNAWSAIHLRLSLDGFSDAHDESRGQDGTFKHVMETMTALAELRKRKRFRLAVNFTVTDKSLPDVDALIKLCNEKNIDVVPGFKVKPFLKHCDVSKEKVTTIGVEDPRKALPFLMRKECGARTGFNFGERTLLHLLNKYVFKKHAAGGKNLKFECREVRNLMYLNPYGELITCGLRQEPIGSIAKDGFESVWHSENALAARSVVDNCTGCMQGAVEIMSKLYV